MKEHCRIQVLQAVSGLVAVGISKEDIPKMISDWAKEWLDGLEVGKK